MPEPAKPAEIDAAVQRLRDALDRHGLLLRHDATLPSATLLIAGTPIRGSWWGHEKGRLIYAALSRLEGDVVSVKLVKGKETLLARRLWPALIAVGLARQPWQIERLAEDAREILKRLDREAPLRTDEIELPSGSRKVAAVVGDLERRLLVHADSIHTKSGHHVRLVEPWQRFRERHGIKDLPSAAEALDRLTTSARDALGDRYSSGLLPWSR